ncbi:MAG: hypothetical protein WA900_04420 [Casimicrobiaceae bacterium]
MRKTPFGALAVGCMLALTGLAHGQTSTERIHGDVLALHGRNLELKVGAAQVVAVHLADKVRVSGRSAADLGEIKPGSFVGTTAIPQPDGTLSAVEVHIFPESMRGTGEGYRPMDAKRGSTMTNATVTSVAPAGGALPRNTMTNATVASVAAGGAGRRITLKYNGGQKTVVVGPSVPVVMIEPGDLSMLVPGAHVLVTATKQSDGALTAYRVSVGINGLVPPI